MLATTGQLPADDGRWSYEVKWDGVRLLVAVESGRLELRSRNRNDVTGAYPELRGLGAALDGDALLDAEVVAFDGAGRPDFGRLQSRMHARSPGAALVRDTPVTLLLFDALHVGDRSLLQETYDVRREVLEALVPPADRWQVPPAFTADGEAVLAATLAQGMEGVVAKRRDSRYEPGRRSECWVKVKHVHRTSAVVVGWKPGEGGRAGRIGSLLLAVPAGAGWAFAGHVGTGFSAATLRALGDRLLPLRRADPVLDDVPREHARHAVWVEPELVCEVDYTEWTREGRLRHPSYKGLRDDLDPRSVVRQ
jgi:bifunctional non-homologous end joining protein LigD